MTAGSQCDNCRKFVPQHAPGMLYLVRQPPPEQSSFIASILGTPAEPLTFCRMRCVAEYAMAHALIEGSAAGTEPG